MAASIAEKWEELSGKENWKGLLNPLDLNLRKYIIQYGELSQATYDTFISEQVSKNAGSSRYSMEHLFAKVGLGLDPEMYRVTKYFYATSSFPLPEAFMVKSWSREAWSKESNFMGYIAVATDKGKAVLGRREIVIAWRGSIRTLEWVNDFQFLLVPAPKVFGDGSSILPLFKPLVHQGWNSIYTTDDPKSPFNKASSRDQVLEEVKRLIEEYKNEKVSITVTGHSLGAALATLNAVDIVYNGFNKTSNGKVFPVTAFVFASPNVGDLNFRAAFSKLKNLHILRVENILDIVPKYPPIGYVDVGEVLLIDTVKSNYLKSPGNFLSWHNLEAHLHGVAGTQGVGVGVGFKLEVNRDIALVNKSEDVLKVEYGVPAKWWIEKNKGMVQKEDKSWVLMDREDYEI
ncbi:Phospholipase A1-II 1 [Capsicum baccatum]|uniref:Phospholipase A1 n=1 Tax=Capsicum baccatum TaxID=33114 RepID=A0A2G2VBT1_CAPBA|nr:Phospholipase A1-II 1 [Capsicum baccatum]